MHPNDGHHHKQLPLPHKNKMQDDNIDIIELWILQRKYRKQFIVAFLFFMLVGILYTYFVHTQAYSLVTTIQIGTRERDSDISPIETPESLLSKINNAIVPSYSNDWMQENSYRKVFRTTTSNPDNSNIILISNQVSEKEIELITDFQKGLVAIVKDDHKRIIKSLKSPVLTELGFAKIELQKLMNPITLEYKMKIGQIKYDEEAIKLSKLEDKQYFDIQKAEFKNNILRGQHESKILSDLEAGNLKQFERIEENKKILLETINNLKSQISEATKNRRAAAVNATELSAMSQLLIGNEIQQNQNRLRSLEERYYVELENVKTELMQKIEEIRLKKIESEKKLDLLNEKYKRMIADNQFMRAQQKLKVEEAKMMLEQIKLEHLNDIKRKEEKVREINTRLDNFNETRIVSIAVPSLRRTGSSQLQLLVMIFIGSLFAGIVAMLLAMFRNKVNEKLEEVVVG
ncbi:MAG: hypothetical protein KZQ80_00935 [Candidatus Thiodiazotropha sp. (ex Monitilora ramsayi)]|nr:hypothetical protein [Candidatus Thiodiazotropha sp. (ex Monitilora ramsayi)]